MSMPPPSAASRLGDRALDLRVVGGVGDDGNDRRAGLVDELGGGGREPLGVAREERDRRALEREAARDRVLPMPREPPVTRARLP